MKTRNLMAIGMIGLMLATALGGCVGGEKGTTGGTGGGTGTGGGAGNQTGDNQTGNQTTGNATGGVMELYMTAKVIRDLNFEEPPVPELPIPVSKEYEATMVKPTGADEKAATGDAFGGVGYDTWWSIKLNESIKITSVAKFHIWIEYVAPNAPIEIDVRMYKNYEELASAYIGFIPPEPLTPGIYEYEIDLGVKGKKFAANDILTLGVLVFGGNVNQAGAISMVCGAEHPSGASFSYVTV